MKPANKALQVDGFVTAYAGLSEELKLSGSLISSQELEIKPEVSGRVTVINFKEGAYVTSGQTLLVFYNEDLIAQLRKLEAQRVTLDKTLGRLEELLKIEGVSRQEYDDKRLELQGVEADISLLQAQISKTVITAPFSGRIGLTRLTRGTYVQAGTTVAVLQNVRDLDLLFTIPEKYAPLAVVNYPVNFEVDGYKGPFVARISAVESSINETSRTLAIKARYHNNAGLFPGTFARITLALASDSSRIVVPTRAVIPEARNKKVIVSSSGMAEFRIVETGVRTSEFVEIVSGLMPGDTVVVSGMMQVKPKAQISFRKIINSEQES